ncbi:hypothetical protein JB92DRAFT_3116229 [Gautieria morchelliformis]|nr:hypothetical protein JB92DRAFT_3116229 [Gautieria morchelliformis]
MATPTIQAILERTQMIVKVCPDFQGELREEMEQWVGDAEEIQAELWKALRVEAVVDPDFERPTEVDELAKEVKEAKVWLEGSLFTLQPLFSEAEFSLAPCPVPSRHPSKEPEATQSSGKEPEVLGKAPAPVPQSPLVPRRSVEPQVVEPPVRTKRQPIFLYSDEEGDNAPTPKKVKTGDASPPVPEAARRPSVEIIPDEQPSVQRRKGHANAQVAEADTYSARPTIGQALSMPESAGPDIPLAEIAWWLARYAGVTRKRITRIEQYVQCSLMGAAFSAAPHEGQQNVIKTSHMRAAAPLLLTHAQLDQELASIRPPPPADDLAIEAMICEDMGPMTR